MSIGIVVSLIPNALLGEILKLLIPHFPILQHQFDITVFVMNLLPVMIGVMVGISFKLTPIQTARCWHSCHGWKWLYKKRLTGSLALNGIGIVINTGITAALTVIFVQFIGRSIKRIFNSFNANS